MTTLYQATTNATGGRAGHVLSEDGPIDMALSVPKSMGGDDGSGVNPEQLLGQHTQPVLEVLCKLLQKYIN